MEQLIKPFPVKDIEWRVQSSGVKNEKPWAMVLAYVTARAVQNRFDEVFGVLGWKDTYDHVQGGVICTLSVFNKESGEWVAKQNGSPETQIEAFKGGISKAFVRVAASGFGVGRYLYNLDTSFVNDKPNGKRFDVIKDKKGNKIGAIKWDEPTLPSWAADGKTPAIKEPEIPLPPSFTKEQQSAIDGWKVAGKGEIGQGRNKNEWWTENKASCIKECSEGGAKLVHAAVVK